LQATIIHMDPPYRGGGADLRIAAGAEGRMWGLWALWCGCAESPGGEPGTVPATTPSVVSGGGTASCEATENALRFACTATLDAAAEGLWTLSLAGEPVRTFATPSGLEHAVTLYGMRPDTDYDWAIDAGTAHVSGTLHSGDLPADLAGLDVSASGDPGPVTAVLTPQQCNGDSFLVVADTEGEPIWYEPTASGGIQGAAWTEDDTFLWGEGQRTIVEMTAGGERLWEATGFDRPLHHDLNKGGGRVYALNADAHDNVVVDGLYVLQDGALVAEWDLYDHATVGSDGTPDPFWWGWFPGSEDWSHANSVWSDGTVAVLSLRWQDAIIEIAADPAAPDFGTITSTLTGSSNSDFISDFTWTDGGDFDGQHHVTPTADGYLMFDNQGGAEPSRALRIEVDDASATVAEAESWSMDQHCEVQGGAYPLSDGSVLATCATEGRILRFVPGEPEAVFDMSATCGRSGGATIVARGVPLDW
jgi:hypothetical protein